MIDLHDLEGRVAMRKKIVLDPQQGAEIVAELKASRAILGLCRSDLAGRDLGAQRDMVAQLLRNLSQGLADDTHIDLVATVVVAELSALARCQVRTEVYA